MTQAEQISQAIATVERQISEAKSETAKKVLAKKLERLKEDLKKAKPSLTTLPKARKTVKALNKSAFQELVEELSKKPEYAFLKNYSQERFLRDKARTAKPKGYRFKGDNDNIPTADQVKKGLKNGTVYYEGRPIRSDISREIRLKTGGNISSFDWKNFTLQELNEALPPDVEITYYKTPEKSYNRPYSSENKKFYTKKRLTISQHGEAIVSKGNENIYLDIKCYNAEDRNDMTEYEVTVYSKENHTGLKDVAKSLIEKMKLGGNVKADLKALWDKTVDIAKKGYDKTKEVSKKKIHDGKKAIAIDVINETKGKVGKTDKYELNKAKSIIVKKFADGGTVKFRKLAKSNNFDIIVSEGRFEVELDSNNKVKSIVHPSGERHKASECPIYQKYKKEINSYLTERFAEGGGLETIQKGDKVIWGGNEYTVFKITENKIGGFVDKKYHLHSYKVGVDDAILDSLKGVSKPKFAKGGGVGSMDVEIQGFKRNRMGTLSFDLKLSNMRKFQDFIVYPVQKGDDNIKIQSDTRIGRIYMSSGKGEMSQSHSSGAYGVHLAMDKLVPFQLSSEQLEELKSSLRATAGDKVGDYGIVSDNSGADQFAKGGMLSTEEEKRFQELDEKIDLYLEGKAKVSSKEMAEHAKLKHKKNVATNPEYRKQMNKFRYAEGGGVNMSYAYGNHEYKNSFGIEQKDFIQMVDAYYDSYSENQYDRIESRMTFSEMRDKYGEDKVDEVGNYIHEIHELHSKMAKGGGIEDLKYKYYQTYVNIKKGFDLVYFDDNSDIIGDFKGTYETIELAEKQAKKDGYTRMPIYNRYAEGGNIDSSYLGTTRIGKGHYGWTAKTTTKKQINGYDWEITTMKRSSGDLVSSANGGKSEQKEGYSTFMYSPFEDPSFRLVSSKPKMVNEKAVTKQHEEALKIFIEKLNEMKGDKMATGGGIEAPKYFKNGGQTYTWLNVTKMKSLIRFNNKKEAQEAKKILNNLNDEFTYHLVEEGDKFVIYRDFSKDEFLLNIINSIGTDAEWVNVSSLKKEGSFESETEARKKFESLSENASKTYYLLTDGRKNTFYVYSDSNKSDKLVKEIMATGGSVGEKTYNVMHNVGKSKYVVNFHDGVKTHSDGSPFFDIEIFKNLKGLKAFTKKLDSEGYKKQMKSGGELRLNEENYIMIYAKVLEYRTGLNSSTIEHFVYENHLNDDELLNILQGIETKKLSVNDLVSAVLLKKGNKKAKEIVSFAKSDKAFSKMATGGGVKQKDENYNYIVAKIESNEKALEKTYGTERVEQLQQEIQMLKDKLKNEYGVNKMATGGSLDKIKIGNDDFSFLLKLSDKELTQRLDLVRKQQSINGSQYMDARSKKEDTSKIEGAGERLAKQERAIIEARIRNNKMATGGSIKASDKKFKEVQDLGSEQYYTRYFGKFETEKGEIELMVVATIRDLEDYVSEDELPKEGNFQLSFDIVPKEEFISEDLLEQANDEDSSAVSDDSLVNIVNYMGGLRYEPSEKVHFKTHEKALKHLMSIPLNKEINSNGEYPDNMIYSNYNRAGSTNEMYLDYMIGVSDKFFKEGGNVGKSKKNKYLYIPNQDISKIVLKSKQVIGKNRILDGAYVKGGKQKEKFTDKYKFPIGSVVWDKTHKTYGVVLNNYGDEVFGSHDEIRLDSDGNQNIHTYDKKWNNNGYNLVPYGSEEDKGDGDLTDNKWGAVRIIEMNSNSKYLAENKKYYEDAYKDLLSGKIDGKPFKVNSEKVIGETSTGKSIYQKYTSMPDLSYEELKEASDIHKKFSKKAKTEAEKETALKYSREFMRMANEEKFAKGLGKFATGGNIDKDRLFNFLKDDLEKLKEAIKENDQEEIDKFFSYWNQHLKGLRSESNERMYNFLKDDLEELKEDIEENDQEDIDKFFSYWGQHLEAVKFATGGNIDVWNLKKGDKIRTRKGDIETVERKIESGYFTKESEYSHPFEGIEFVSRPSKKMATGGNIDDSVEQLWRGYASAILFAETDYETEEPLDYNYSISDFDEETEKDSKNLLRKFYTENKKAIEESGLDLDTIGNDIWYTRAGHGAGFFDHSLDSDVEEALTNGAKALGEHPDVETYDGKISVRGGRVFEYKKGGKITKEDALQEAIAMGVDFNKEFHAQSFGNELTELAKKVGYRKAPSSSGSTGRAFFYHLQKIYDKKKFSTGGNIRSDVEKYKKQLIAKAKSKGLYENFGQDEVRKLEDKYGYTSEVRAFDDWAMNFDLSSVKQYATGGSVSQYIDGMTEAEILKSTVVYDNGGETIDRYTVFAPDGSVYGMSENPTRAFNGFNQYIGDESEIEKGSHLGKRLKTVPKGIKSAVLDRMKEEFADGGMMYAGGGNTSEDLSGNYFSSTDFVETHELTELAKETFGDDWESGGDYDYDIEEIRLLIKKLGGGYKVLYFDNENRDKFEEAKSKYFPLISNKSNDGDLFVIPTTPKKARGGNANYSYIEKDKIDRIVTNSGKEYGSKVILDGAYVTDRVRTPKMSRTQFEDETYSFGNGGNINFEKHIWEGWTVGDFIQDLEPSFDQIMSGRSWQKPFTTKQQVKEWCMDNQPYYKKHVPEVVNYFWAKVEGKFATGGTVGDYFYDTRKDKAFQVIMEDGDKMAIQYLDRSKSPIGKAETISKNEFEYYVQMGAWNKWKQEYATGGEITPEEREQGLKNYPKLNF